MTDNSPVASVVTEHQGIWGRLCAMPRWFGGTSVKSKKRVGQRRKSEYAHVKFKTNDKV